MAKDENSGENKNTQNKNEDKKTKVKPIGTVVKFLKSFTPYVKGDIAGIDDKLADKLLEEKIVIKYKK